MGAIRDFIDAFKPGLTKPGMWRDMEKYGRFEGSGEIDVQVELPGGPTMIGIEDFLEVEDFEFELTGPDGQPVEMKRWTSGDVDTSDPAVHRLVRIATGEIREPGLHHLRVKAAMEGQPLLILVGEELTVGGALSDMAEEMIPGRKLWKRLRGED